jgi:hypothetical protein
MNLVFKCLAIAFLIFAPPRIAFCLHDDFQNPQRWDQLGHNPYVSLALLGVFLVLAVVVGWHVWRTERAERSRREERQAA